MSYNPKRKRPALKCNLESSRKSNPMNTLEGFEHITHTKDYKSRMKSAEELDTMR